MSALSLAHLSKRFGATLAVDEVSLDVPGGAFVALLGPSGCGKTTVMRMIAGIIEPDAGEVAVGGRSLAGVPPERRNIGLVFQSYALFPHMSVAANVGFGLKMRGIGRAERDRRVSAALSLVDLGTLAERYPRQLSGGQQQRVALARALVIEPDILLLDEPLSNLDAKLRESLREDLAALQRRLGVTALYVTHDQAEAMALADEVVVMSAGKMIERGAPIDLYRRPQTRFTAEFLGHANLIAGVVESGVFRLPWGGELALDLPPGPMRLCIRPEDIRLESAEDGPGRILAGTFLGSDVDYRIGFGNGVELRARVSGGAAAALDAGSRVRVHLPAAPHAIAGGNE